MPASRRSISLATLVIPPLIVAGSLAVLGIGIVMVVTENDALVAALNSTTATAADVYGGQARVAVASGILAAGILALVVSLATVAITGSIRAFALRPLETASPDLEAHDTADGSDDDLDLDDEDGMRASGPVAAADDVADDRALSPRAS